MLIQKKQFDKIYNTSGSKYIEESPLLYTWLKKHCRLDELEKEPTNTYTLSSEVVELVKEIAVQEKCNETVVIESIIRAYAEATRIVEREHGHQFLAG